MMRKTNACKSYTNNQTVIDGIAAPPKLFNDKMVILPDFVRPFVIRQIWKQIQKQRCDLV